MRKWLVKILFGFDFFQWKQRIEIQQETITLQVASLTDITSTVMPFTKEWPEVVSKAIISLDDRVKEITILLKEHKATLQALTKDYEENAQSSNWLKKRNIN